MYVSIHRYDQGQFYPAQKGSPKLLGKGKGFGFNIHFGFDNFTEFLIGDLDYIYACESLLFPIIRDFAPEAIIISCGFDSALGDPLGQVGVTPLGYAWMTHGLVKICPKVISILEGGYDLEALAKSSQAVLEALFIDPEDDKGFSKLIQKLSTDETSGYGSSY